MPRSVKKGPWRDKSLEKKIQKANRNNPAPIKTWSRRSAIMPDMIGYTFLVHNGKKFTPVYITEAMIGHKLGEFAPTRTYYGHAADKKSKRR